MTAAKNAPGLRRRLGIAAAVVALAVACGGAWYGWVRYTAPPPPPDVPLDVFDPAVAEVIQAARQKVLQDSHSAPAWGKLGKLLRANGLEQPSNVCFAQAERFDPEEPRWPYYQGLTLVDRNPEAALPFLRRAVERADKHDRANDTPRLLLVETLLQTEAYDEAETQLDLVRDPTNPRTEYEAGLLAVARQDDPAAARHFLAAASGPGGRRKAYGALAAVRQRQGDAAGAAEYSQKAAAAPEERTWPDGYVAECIEMQNGRRAGAIQAAKLLEAGRPQEALPILEDLARDPADVHAQITLGIGLYYVGRLEEAEQYLRATIGSGTEQAEANHGLAVVLYSEGQKLEAQSGASEAARAKYREAVQCDERALALKPDQAMAQLYRGLALMALARKKEAIESFRQATLLRPEMIAAHLALGNALAENGQDAEAALALQHACELAPDDVGPREALAKVRKRLHKQD